MAVHKCLSLCLQATYLRPEVPRSKQTFIGNLLILESPDQRAPGNPTMDRRLRSSAASPTRVFYGLPRFYFILKNTLFLDLNPVVQWSSRVSLEPRQFQIFTPVFKMQNAKKRKKLGCFSWYVVSDRSLTCIHCQGSLLFSDLSRLRMPHGDVVVDLSCYMYSLMGIERALRSAPRPSESHSTLGMLTRNCISSPVPLQPQNFHLGPRTSTRYRRWPLPNSMDRL